MSERKKETLNPQDLGLNYSIAGLKSRPIVTHHAVSTVHMNILSSDI